MKLVNNLFLVIVFILFWGCNSNRSDVDNKNKVAIIKNAEIVQSVNTDSISSKNIIKDEELSKIDPKIKDLLKKTKVLQVPLSYSYEDTFNISTVENVEPLSDEMQDLLSVNKIHDWITDFSGILWVSCRLNLSKNFKTLIFSIYTGGEGKNVLVNYSNDFKFIDYKHITFEDYVEGCYGAKALIERDKIILYKTTYSDHLKKDTISFKINNYGRIDSVIVRK